MRTEAWKVILLAAAPATAAAIVAGPELRPVVVSALSVFGLILVFARTRQLPPGSKVAWFTFGLAGALMLLGAIVRTAHGGIIGVEDPLPSPADVLFATGYGLLIVGEIHFLRARSSEPDRDAWIDALIIAAGVGLVLWAVLIGPYVRDPSAPLGERITNVLYLGLTLSLVAATVRLTAAPGARAPSYYLLAGAVTTFFLNDLLGTVAYARGGGMDILLVLTPMTYAFFCAALYHPSVVRLTERPKHVEPRLSVGRLVVLAAALMIPPAVLIYELNLSRRPADEAVIAAAALTMAAMVLVRLARLVRARERLADREHALRRAGEDLASAATPEEVHGRAASAAQALPASAEVEAAGTVVVVDGQPRLMSRRGEGGGEHTLAWPVPDPSHEDDDLGAVRLPDTTGGPLYAAPFGGSGPTDGALFVRTDNPLDRHDRRGLETLARETALALRGLHGAEIHHRQRSEKRFRSLVQNSADIVSVVKPGTGRVIYVSPAVERLLGLSTNDLVGRRFVDLVHEDDRTSIGRVLSEPAPMGTRPVEARLPTNSGGWSWFDVVVVDQTDDPEIAGYLVNARESNDRRAAQQRLLDSEARFRSLVQNSTDIVAVLDADEGTVTYVSPAIETVLGYRVDDVVGTNLLPLVDEQDRAELANRIATLAAQPDAQDRLEIRTFDRAREHRLLDVTLTDLRDNPAIGGVVVNARDITLSRELESNLLHAAYHDSLTGLPNRLLLSEKVDRALSRSFTQATAVAVLFIDLDDFKTVNDGLGHVTGDRVLCQVAERLQRCVRLSDTAARLGGDEFAVLIPDCYGEGDAQEVSERILTSIREPMDIEGRQLTTSASIGIALDTDGETSADVLLRNADTAMYLAKETGKDRAQVFEEQMQVSAFERLELKADLAAAIDDDELFLLYQPVVALDDGHLVGAEALVRWNHPARGVLSPMSFVPLAEDTGLIVPLGDWVLDAAGAQLSEWAGRDSTEHLRMSINLSARQLREHDIVREIADALDRHRLDPATVTVEITESVLMDDTDFTAGRLRAVRELGVSLAIDDFGTGYSSLGYLQRYPFDIIKIDRSFVTTLTSSAQDVEVVRAIIELAHRLEVTTVAEGIEGVGELEVLRELGCRYGQGYHFSRPVPSCAIEEWADNEALPSRSLDRSA